MALLPFTVQYTKASGSQQVPATGLTVTCTVRRVTLSDNTVTSLVAGASAFEIGNGLYGYTYSGTLDFTLYYYTASFVTTDGTVQATGIASAYYDYPLSIAKTSAGKVSEVVLLTGNTPQTADVAALSAACAGGSLAAALAEIEAETDGIAAIPTNPLLASAMTESYNADGAAPTPVQALFVIMQMLTEMNIAGTVMTVKKLDGVTTAFTLTLNSSTSPTSVTRTT